MTPPDVARLEGDIDLRAFPLFQGLPDDEIGWVVANGADMTLLPGGTMFEEGDAASPRFFIVLEGELQVTQVLYGKRQVLGTTPPGVMGGEVALLRGTPTNVTARAIAPSRVLVFDPATFRQIFAHAPTLGTRIFNTAFERTNNVAMSVLQREKLAAMGQMSAGLAHELNNPAAAMARRVPQLLDVLPTLVRQTAALTEALPTPAQRDQVLSAHRDMLAQAQDDAAPRPALSTVARSDLQEALYDLLLDEIGLDDATADDMASAFADVGTTPGALRGLVHALPEAARPHALGFLHTTLDVAATLHTLQDTARRISTLVKAMKEHTYMDRGDLQDVNIHAGLDSTLTLLGHKLRGIDIHRDYDPDLPTVCARGGEINQIWTNLLDNAAYALKGAGNLWLSTRCEDEYAMVEITDDGPGIPPEVQSRLFEPFFTTKPIGEGTGLGLDVVYRIVQAHHGTIEVHSTQNERTRFIVRLPVAGPPQDDAPPAVDEAHPAADAPATPL